MQKGDAVVGGLVPAHQDAPEKAGAQRHNYTGQRGYHPLLAIAAGTGPTMVD